MYDHLNYKGIGISRAGQLATDKSMVFHLYCIYLANTI